MFVENDFISLSLENSLLDVEGFEKALLLFL